MNDFGIWNVDFGGFSKVANRKSKIILTRINFKIQIVGKEGARIKTADFQSDGFLSDRRR